MRRLKRIRRVRHPRRLALTYVAVCMLLLSAVLFSCGPRAQEPEAAYAGQAFAAQAFLWQGSSDCSVCHAKQHDSSAANLGQSAASHSDADCLSCHEDVPGLKRAHAQVTMGDTNGAKRLKSTAVLESCSAEDCHSGLDLTAATASSVALTDERGTVVNPHDMPASESHSTLRCGSCHDMHEDTPLAESSKGACLSCHHENVFECGTCHE